MVPDLWGCWGANEFLGGARRFGWGAPGTPTVQLRNGQEQLFYLEDKRTNRRTKGRYSIDVAMEVTCDLYKPDLFVVKLKLDFRITLCFFFN